MKLKKLLDKDTTEHQPEECLFNGTNVAGTNPSEKEWINSKYLYILHAEMDAILNKTYCSLNGCNIYTLVFPWNECAKLIIESRIKEVVYYLDEYAGN